MGNGLASAAKSIIPRSIRNWIKAPGLTIRWFSDSARSWLGICPRLRLADNVEFRLHPAAARIARIAQLHDPDQVEELGSFIRFCRPGMVFFDLGAHFGIFSLVAARMGGHPATVVGVEPSPHASGVFARNVKLNAFDDRVTVERGAMGPEPGSMKMVSVGIIADGYFIADNAVRPGGEYVDVRVFTIDELVERHARPTHVKIDVEGFELGVLKGGRHTLSGETGPMVFLELHCSRIREMGGDPAECLDLLEEYGYSLVDDNGNPVRREPVLSVEVSRIRAEKTT